MFDWLKKLWHDDGTVSLTITMPVATKLKLEELSMTHAMHGHLLDKPGFMPLLQCSLATYEMLLKAKARGAAVLIREIDGMTVEVKLD